MFARPEWSCPIGLRNTENSLVELTPLSSVACGATPFLGKGAKICAVRRYHNPLNPLNPLNPHP